MLRGIYGDPERYRETYWSRFEGRYFAGDGAGSTTRATSGSSAGSTTS
jgi:acyl-coenzyme A synthetase/AMP-(fatty) acid ligase